MQSSIKYLPHHLLSRWIEEDNVYNEHLQVRILDTDLAQTEKGVTRAQLRRWSLRIWYASSLVPILFIASDCCHFMLFICRQNDVWTLLAAAVSGERRGEWIQKLTIFQLENPVVMLTLISNHRLTLIKIHNNVDDGDAYLEYLELAIKEIHWFIVLIKC